MRKLGQAVAISVAALIAAPTIALAAPVAPVVHSVGTSAAGGVAATGGFIGFVARKSADQCRPAMAAAWIITSNKKEPQGWPRLFIYTFGRRFRQRCEHVSGSLQKTVGLNQELSYRLASPT
jgi:hypothetical protein